jgi:hypothetical protein
MARRLHLMAVEDGPMKNARQTQAQTKAAITALGMVARFAVEYGEWRIDYRQGDVRRTADSAYFTNCAYDAVKTAVAMSCYGLSASMRRTDVATYGGAL